MNRGLQTLVLVPILGLLAGCAQYQWRKQGSTREQFNQDSYECQMQAAAAFPTAIVSQQMTSGYQTPAVTNCSSSGSAYGSYGNVYGNSNTNCTTTPGQTVRPVVYTSDANQENRAQASKACLYARGYDWSGLISNQEVMTAEPMNVCLSPAASFVPEMPYFQAMR